MVSGIKIDKKYENSTQFSINSGSKIKDGFNVSDTNFSECLEISTSYNDRGVGFKASKIMEKEEADRIGNSLEVEQEEEIKPAVALCCGHIFHSDCVEMWLSYKNCCPTCRLDQKGNKPIHLYIDEVATKVPKNEKMISPVEAMLIERGNDIKEILQNCAFDQHEFEEQIKEANAKIDASIATIALLKDQIISLKEKNSLLEQKVQKGKKEAEVFGKKQHSFLVSAENMAREVSKLRLEISEQKEKLKTLDFYKNGLVEARKMNSLLSLKLSKSKKLVERLEVDRALRVQKSAQNNKQPLDTMRSLDAEISVIQDSPSGAHFFSGIDSGSSCEQPRRNISVDQKALHKLDSVSFMLPSSRNGEDPTNYAVKKPKIVYLNSDEESPINSRNRGSLKPSIFKPVSFNIGPGKPGLRTGTADGKPRIAEPIIFKPSAIKASSPLGLGVDGSQSQGTTFDGGEVGSASNPGNRVLVSPEFAPNSSILNPFEIPDKYHMQPPKKKYKSAFETNVVEDRTNKKVNVIGLLNQKLDDSNRGKVNFSAFGMSGSSNGNANGGSAGYSMRIISPVKRQQQLVAKKRPTQSRQTKLFKF
ncbi:hypothetical protein AYI70_g6260 [Smittium culicis]|uniref:RING-type domain-containing protein n=1 Tax=Smittium culicis TaxID=133412 RepID=A0A1R1XQW0_9FUNG|nr:hypothetical protein AYI70_g6260 [Smittium culicis]